jgi:DNA-binding NarL/FixJ family response regulator
MEPAANKAYEKGDSAEAGVLVVDDRPAFLEAARELVRATRGLVVVGEASSAEEALELVEQLKPKLVLMDVSMPGIGGVGAARRIKAAHPSTIVALVSTTRPQDLSRDTEKCPADALLWKNDLRPSVLAEVWRSFRKDEVAAT